MSGNLFTWANARSTDPHTSHLAAEAHRGLLGAHDRLITLLAHAQHPDGLTDFELAAILGRQQTSVGVRRGELRNAGLIEETDITRLSPSRSPAIVWRITLMGRIVAASLVLQ